MNNLLKILAVLVIAVLCYMILATTSRSLKKENEKNVEKITTVSKDPEFDEPEFDEAPTQENENIIEKTISDTSKKLPITSIKEIIRKTDTIKKVSSTDSKNSALVNVKNNEKKEEISEVAKSKETGSILVIAGNYIQESNAKVLKKKLEASGFTNSEVVVFDFSEFYTVISGRYNNQADAKARISALKAKGYDAYTHIKK